MSRPITSTCAAIAAVFFCAVAVIFVNGFAMSLNDDASQYQKDSKADAEIIINEVDSDTPGSDIAEFVELYDGGVGNSSLDGYVVVFFNGGAANDASYAAFDLDGFSTNVDGYFTLGNSGIAGVDLVFANGLLQNGPDAVGLFAVNGSDFPNGTPITAVNIRDALVYANSTTLDAGLLVLLNAGQTQVNENSGGTGTTVSMQRVPNGFGGARNTDSYQVSTPTPDGPVLVPTNASLLLSGRVTDSAGQGIRGAKIVIAGGETEHSAVTNSFGFYNVGGLSAGTYIVTVSARRYVFANPSRTVNMLDDVAGFDFVAEE